MAVFPILYCVHVAVAFLLFVVSHAAGAELDLGASAESDVPSATQSKALSEAPPESSAPPEACRECGGLPYFRPSASPSESVSKRLPKTSSDSMSNALPNVEFDQPHLSSDPRVNTARVLIQRNRFPDALEILRPLALEDRPDHTDVLFLLGLAASRDSQGSRVDDKTRLALLDEAITAFRSILIHEPALVRVRLELALAFFLKGDDDLAINHFERGYGWEAAGRGDRQHPEFFERDAGQAPLERVFRVSPWPRIPISTPPPTRSSSISTACRFAGATRSLRQFRYRRGGLGRRGIPVSPGRTAGACARGSTSTTGNTRVDSSTRPF